MKITIHRGISQVGGCITEIASESGAKILIDLGHNLPIGDEPSFDKYDNKVELDRLLSGVSDIYYTHYHGDHISFEGRIDEHIIQHIGALSKKMLITLKEHINKAPGLRDQVSKDLDAIKKFKIYEAEKSEWVGDIEIIPFYVSHSAIDAHMFLIKCDKRTILHTGDFRDHGWMGSALRKNIVWNIIRKNPVDILITEGTMLSRGDSLVISEKQLLFKAKGIMKNHKYAFVLCSSMDIDRIVSFYHANKYLKEGRLFVADSYQIKQFKNIREKLNKFYGEVYAKNIWHNQSQLLMEMKEKGFTMLVRNSNTFSNLLKSIVPQIDLNKTVFFYSQFSGYIDSRHKAFKKSLYDFVHAYDWKIEELHTSGHASRQTLAEVCELVNPKLAIIPIHKELDTDFRSLEIKEELKLKVVINSIYLDDVEIEVSNLES